MENNRIIKSEFLRAGVKNGNERIYPGEALSNALAQFQEKTKKGIPTYGELGHPDNFDVSLKNVSHSIESLGIKAGKCPRKMKKALKKANKWESWKFEHGRLIGSIRLLDTNAGKTAKKIIKDLVVRPRGQGELTNGVVTNYKVFAYDLINKDTDSYKGIIK